MILASSWADVPNWPLMLGGKNDLEHDRENNKKDKDTISRCDIELSILDKLDKGLFCTLSKISNVYISRSDNIGAIHYVDTPESANVTWFRAVDYDRSGALSYQVNRSSH